MRAEDRVSRKGEYPYYGASGPIDKIDDYLFDGSYLLVGEDGANLLARSKPIAFQAHGKFWVNNHAHVLTTYGEMPLGYFESYFNLIDLASYVTGTAQPKLPQAAMNKIAVPVAPCAEQRRIVATIESYFSRLDDAVKTLERVERNLKRYRASVLKAAVEGRLVPTEAALARQEGRDYEPATVLLEHILTERRRCWSESAKTGKYQEPTPVDGTNLPELPEGWCWTTLDQLITEPLANGRSVPTATDGFPVLRLTCLKEGTIDLTERKIGAWTLQAAEPYLVQRGDFLVARGNGSIRLVGYGGLLRQNPDLVAYPDTLIRIRLSSMFLPEFFAQLWNSRWVRSQIEKRAKTTAGIYKVNQGDLSGCIVPLMPLAEQHRLLEEIERQMSVVIYNEARVRQALIHTTRLRQSILKWAFEGKLADQDPNDEPASVLLERIKAERNAPTPAKKKTRS